MWRWFRDVLKRYVLFTASVIAIGQAYSWLFGYDDEMKRWAGENRVLIVVVLVLSAIVYAMYDWMEEKDR